MMSVNDISMNQLEVIAAKIRREVVRMSHDSRTPHLGSSLSVVDILTAVYWTCLSIDPLNPDAEERDKFILSKGHAVSALYVTLAFRGFFPEETLSTFAENGTILGEHPLAGRVPGLEAATGSLGHGLSMGAGIALADKIKNRNSKTIVVMSDGECNEGSVWEAAMFAPAHELENLMLIIDYNKWQATGRSNEIMSLDPLPEKWSAFGWTVREIDGHDMSALAVNLSSFPDGSGKPLAIIAHTVKGKGISFMEDDNNWHYRIPSDEEAEEAFKELALN